MASPEELYPGVRVLVNQRMREWVGTVSDGRDWTKLQDGKVVEHFAMGETNSRWIDLDAQGVIWAVDRNGDDHEVRLLEERLDTISERFVRPESLTVLPPDKRAPTRCRECNGVGYLLP